MNYKIVLTPYAIKNIDDAIDYYKTVASVKVAKSFIDDYKTTFKDIQKVIFPIFLSRI